MSLLLKGFAIGLAISAPVGPIGLLCIRRSMVDGRLAGLSVGMRLPINRTGKQRP